MIMYKMPAILEILMSHPVENLRKEIAKTNIKGYATASKKAIVEKMLLHSARFQHIKMYEKKAASEKQVAARKRFADASKAKAVERAKKAPEQKQQLKQIK